MIAAPSHCKLGGSPVESNSDLLSTVNKLPVFYNAWKNTKTQATSESTNISSTNSMSSSNSSNSSCTSPIAGSTKSSSSSSSLLQPTNANNANAMQSHHDNAAPPTSAHYYMNQQQQHEYQLYMDHHHQHNQHQHNHHNQIHQLQQQQQQQTQSQYSDPHFLHKALTGYSVSQTHDMTNANALPASSWWDQHQPTGIASNPTHLNPGHHHGFNNLAQPSFNYDSTTALDSYNQVNSQYSHTAQDYTASHQRYSQLFTSNSPASSVMAAYHNHLSKNFPSKFHIFPQENTLNYELIFNPIFRRGQLSNRSARSTAKNYRCLPESK